MKNCPNKVAKQCNIRKDTKSYKSSLKVIKTSMIKRWNDKMTKQMSEN